jgi:hypothetical protein
MGRIKISLRSIGFVPSIDDHDIFWLCKVKENDSSFGSIAKDIIFVTLLYLTCGFLVVFLAEVTPTSRQDSFRLKKISTGFLKGGAKEDEAPGVRGETITFPSNAII